MLYKVNKLFKTGYLVIAIKVLSNRFTENYDMSITLKQIIEKIKTSPFTPKDYSKDVEITIDGIGNLFPEENKIDILKSLSGSNNIDVDSLTGKITFSKELFI